MSERAFSIQYPLNNQPGPGAYLEVIPGIIWLRMPLPLALDHINLWLIDEGESWALVDTGFNAAVCRGVWDSLSMTLLKGKPIGRIIVTHYHPDHIGLAGYLYHRYETDLSMTQITAERARFLFSGRVDDCRDAVAAFCRLNGVEAIDLYVNFVTGQNYRQIISALPEQVGFVHHERPINLAGSEWRPIVARGHAEDHLSLYNPQLNILISGDQVLPAITTNVGIHFNNADEDALAQYLASMDRFSALPEDALVLPSHGKVFKGLHNRIAFIHENHQRQLDKTLALCTVPMTAWDMTHKLFTREMDELNTLLAFGESLAHLTYLANRGRLQQQLVNGVCYYAHGDQAA